MVRLEERGRSDGEVGSRQVGTEPGGEPIA
jgi:hypothetical protein